MDSALSSIILEVSFRGPHHGNPWPHYAGIQKSFADSSGVKFHSQVPFIQLYSPWRSLLFLPKRNLLLLQCYFLWEFQSCLSSRNWYFFSWPVLMQHSLFLVCTASSCDLNLLNVFLPFEHKWPPNLPLI